MLNKLISNNQPRKPSGTYRKMYTMEFVQYDNFGNKLVLADKTTQYCPVWEIFYALKVCPNFPIVLFERLRKKKQSCPVRETFGKIVLLDRSPTRQTPL